MAAEFQKNVTLSGVCAFNYAGVAVSSASWGQWNDTSNTKLGYAGVRANANIRYAFVYAFATPSWEGDITKLELAIKLQEELGNSRTIRWSLTSTNPTGSTTMYTGKDLPTDAGRISDGTITVEASTDQWYQLEIDLSSLEKNSTYYLVLSPYTTSSGTSNYATVNMQSSWADVFAGTLTYEADASAVNVPDGTIGSELVITMTDDGLSKTLTYEFGNATGTIVSGTTASAVSWTPPSSLANQIPNDTSGTCTITCTTTAGETTDTCTLSVPASARPYISTGYSIEPYNENSTVAGWGIYLQNWSKLRLQFTARGVYSSRIVSWRFTSGAVTLEGTYSGSGALNADVNSDVITVAGTFTGTLTVTDSRGRSSSVTIGSFTVQAYTEPTAVNYSVYRCLQNGTRDDSEGTYLYCIAKKSYSQVGNNTWSMQFQYKLTTASNYTSAALQDNTALITGGGNIDILKSYNVRIAITDSLTTTYISMTISTQETPFNMKPSAASGIGFGGFAQEDRVVELFGTWALRLPSVEQLLIYQEDGVTVLSLGDMLGDVESALEALIGS